MWGHKTSHFLFLYINKNLTNMRDIKLILTESKTTPDEVQHYLESWLKQPQKSKEMYDIIGAIVQGAKDAYEYRTDSRYADSNNTEYDKASEALKKFIDQLK